MGRMLDIDSPQQVITAAAQYTGHITDATGQVSTTLRTLNAPMAGSSPLDVAGAALRTAATTPIGDKVSQTNGIADGLLGYTIIRTLLIGTADTQNGVGIGQTGRVWQT